MKLAGEKDSVQAARCWFTISLSVNPVLKRELLVQARARQTPWLRVMGGGFALLLLLAATSDDPNLFATSGQSAFIGLNKLIVVFVWMAAPILTADCLSKEKRDGTMGLLFLTPLSAQQIVVAKASAQSLRILAMVLAAYPVLMLPLLFGGVTWQDAVRLALLHLASITFSLSAGVAASSLTEGWFTSRLLALAFAFVSALGFVGCYLGWVSVHMWHTIAWLHKNHTLPQVFLQQCMAFSYQIGLHGGGFAWFWHGNPSWSKANDRVVTTVLAFFCTLLLSGVTVQLAAAGLTRTWRPTLGYGRWARWKVAISRNIKHWNGQHTRLLNDRPIAWQQWHSSKFWLGSVACCAFAAIPVGYVWLAGAKPGPVWFADLFFFGIIAAASPSSFRHDQEAGLMEPLLVTPLSKRTLVQSRFIGILYTWLPAAILYSIAIFAIECHHVDGTVARLATIYSPTPAVPHFNQWRELVHRLLWPGAVAAMGMFASTIRLPPGIAVGIILFFFAIIPLTEYGFQYRSPGPALLAAFAFKDVLISGAFLWSSLYFAERKLMDRFGAN